MNGISRGAVRREMLDLPPASITGPEIAVNSVTAAKVANGTFDAAALAAKFAALAKPLSSRGAVMRNRVFMNGAAGAAIIAGDFISIGADTYEFRAVTPPIGGTAGRIWVYNGANAAASRTNLIDAINGTVDAARINRTSATNTEFVGARVSTAATTVDIYSSVALGVGGVAPTAAPSSTALVLVESLTTVADVWDAPTPTAMYGGHEETTGGQVGSTGHAAIAVTAEMVAKGDLQIQFTFVPQTVLVFDRVHPHTEVTTIAGNNVNVTLGGGGAPIAAGETIDVFAFGI